MANLLGKDPFPKHTNSGTVVQSGFQMCVDRNSSENTAQCQRKLFLKYLITKIKS